MLKHSNTNKTRCISLRRKNRPNILIQEHNIIRGEDPKFPPDFVKEHARDIIRFKINEYLEPDEDRLKIRILNIKVTQFPPRRNSTRTLKKEP
jgi:hypothetical protein